MKKPTRAQNANQKLCLLFLTLAFALFTGSCSQTVQDASNLNDEQRKEIELAVLNRFNGMVKYAEAGDLEKTLGFIDQSGSGSYIDGLWRYPSLQQMIDSYQEIWKVQKQDFGIPDTKIFVLSPTIALVSSTAKVSHTNKDGISYEPRPWSFTALWILKNGQWQIHSFHQFAGEAIPVEEKKGI